MEQAERPLVHQERQLTIVDRVTLHLFCASIVGVLLKQLRFFGDSLGPFEIIALACSLYFIASNRKPPSEADKYFMKFTTIRVAAFLAGAIVSSLFAVDHFSMREVLATIFIVTLLTGWISAKSVTYTEKIKLLTNYICIYCAVITAIAIIPYRGFILLWYTDDYFGRLMGLSDNPNQLAAFAIAGVIGTVLLAQQRQNILTSDLFLGGSAFIAGILTKSMAFRLSIVVIGLVAVAGMARSKNALQITISRLLRIAGLIGIVSATILLLFYGPQLADYMYDLYYGHGGKGASRVAYWLIALNELLYSPIVGLGPGGHVRAEHTPELQEAHNIVLEILLSGGLLALIAFMVFVWGTAQAAGQRRLHFVVACLASLVAFGLFHTVLRHMTYWIMLHACVVFALAESNAKTETSS